MSVAELTRRLDEAEERSTIYSVLGDIVTTAGTSKDDLFLVECVVKNISKVTRHLTSSEVESSLDIVFVSSPVVSVPLLASALSQNTVPASMITRLYSVLERCLGKELVNSLSLNPSDEEGVQLQRDFVNSLVTLKDRFSNVGLRLKMEKREVDRLNSGIESLMYSAVVGCLQTAFEMVSRDSDVNLSILSMLVAKGRNVLIKDSNLLDLVVAWFCHQPDSPLWDRIAERLFTDETCGAREFESMVAAVVVAVNNGHQLRRCLGYSIKRLAAVRRVCSTRLLLQRVCPDKVVTTLADYISTAGGNDVYLETFRMLLSVWSDPSGIKYTALEQQKYLTRAVLAFGRILNDPGLRSEWPSLFTTIITGVQARLPNPDICIRQSGMFVGESCSTWMESAVEPLKFDYVEDDWLTEMKNIVSPASSQVDDTLPDSPDVIDLPQLSQLSINQYASTVLDSDDEEDFPAFEVPDSEINVSQVKEGEEPESKCPPPFYIRDCMDRLDEKEKYEVFESAFFCLESMIRRKAIGFDDIAPQLVNKLIHITDRFKTNEFEKVRKSCIVACLVFHPELAPSLCETMYSRNCSFFQRYLILDCLLSASKELSSPPPSASQPAVTEVNQTQPVDSSNWRAVVDERIRLKTRRFGGAKAPALRQSVNRFASVATLFFYPLLRTSTGDHLKLKGKDSPFFSRVLFTAGDILQSASRSTSIIKMAQALTSLVLPLRFHEDSSVRGAVLFAYFSVTAAISDEVFVEAFYEEAQHWLAWSCSVADNVNLSEQDRNMAKHVSAVILQKLQSRDSMGIAESAD